MARGEVARLCKVGEGKTSSGRNSGSSAKRSSKYTSDSTLPDQQGHTPTEYIHTRFIDRFSGEHTPRVSTHLSTESKVFLSGGGRALSFLGVGGSLSVCGGGRLGSVVADGGRRGDEERHSFHPACRECSHKLFFSCLVSQKSQGSIGLMFLSPPWCHRGFGTQKDLRCWSSPGLAQMAAPQLGVLMERTECQR